MSRGVDEFFVLGGGEWRKGGVFMGVGIGAGGGVRE